MSNHTTKQCPVCDKEFRPLNKRKKTCSVKCGRQLAARNHTRSSEQAIEIFWSRVDRSGGDKSCWNWTASRKPAGYGHMSWNGRENGTHRISWELAHGAIPDGLFVLHACDNPRCVNPAHLFLGTHQDNVTDMMRKGRSVNLRGEQHGNCKLSDAQVAEIRRRYEAGDTSCRKLAAEFEVAPSNINKIVLGMGRQRHDD